MKRDMHRVLLVCTHPVQYFTPILQRMAVHPKLDIQVAYCGLQGAQPDTGTQTQSSASPSHGMRRRGVQVPNHSWHAGLGRFWGLLNPGL
jgi:hypothetical protein